MVARPRIGFLTYGLDRPLSGVTRVAQELGRALQRAGECEVVFLTPYARGPFRGERGTAAAALPGCRLLPGLLALGGPLIALAARRRKLDLVHDPIGVSPFTLGRWAGGFKRVVTLHDAIAFRYPQGYPWLNNFVHRRYVPWTLPNVDGVITDSEDARRDLGRYLQLPLEGVQVVPLGVDPRFRPLPVDEARAAVARLGVVGPYVLSVGAQQARKNVARLVEAFARVRRRFPSYRLVIAGPALWRHPGFGQQIEALGLREAVTVLGYVPDDALPALYGAAGLFAFPSLYEGFGLPVLEAMACGTPVVCANATSLPELAGDAAVLVDPTDTTALAGAMERVLGDPALQASLRARGQARAATFTWERTARETAAVYRRVV
jgi:glycosyltransferase involved in cell wall biosynthesis